MLNNQDRLFGYEPLPGANAQERQQAAREQWRLEEERLRDEEERLRYEEERRRQQEEWAHRLEERMRAVAERDLDEYPTHSAAGSLFEYLRHHWAVWQQNRQGRRGRGR
jgi:hypothetical protein